MKIFDLHNDTFTEMFDRNIDLRDMSLAVNTSLLNGYKTTVCQYAVWIKGQKYEDYFRYHSVLENGVNQLKLNQIKVLENADDLKKIVEGNFAMLSLEGAGFIHASEMVDMIYADGIRTVSLTWNDDNRLAGGALDDGVLTQLGKEVIYKLNSHNMAVDLSHLNRISFFKVLELAKHPLVTHAGIDFLVPHKRNLTYEQIKAISSRNGVIGLCVYPVFIGMSAVDGFLKAVYSLLDSGFEDNIAFGSDFDGARMSESVKNIGDVVCIYEKCIKMFGYATTKKLFFTNSYNFYVNVLTN